MEKIKPTMYLVALFVIALTLFFATEAESSEPTNPHSVHLGLGAGVINYPGGITQVLGYSYNDIWSATYERMGGKRYSNIHSYSMSRVVWKKAHRQGLFMSIGATYTDGVLEERDRVGKAIVSERLSYRLGIGYGWKLSPTNSIRVGLVHNSTAGRSDRNKGIDRIILRYDWVL